MNQLTVEVVRVLDTTVSGANPKIAAAEKLIDNIFKAGKIHSGNCPVCW
jgi:hypothetical protein